MVRMRELQHEVESAGRIQSRIGEIAVCLRSDAPTILGDFARLYPAGDSTTAAEADCIQMEVRSAGRSRLGRRLYCIYGDGGEIAGPRMPRELFPFLEWGINLRVIARHSQFLQLHAASLVCGGSGFIFAGGSGCGKSTLAVGLMARGWDYFCDEFALVDPGTLSLRPFPKALCIKAGSFDAVRRLGLSPWRGQHYIKALKGRVAYIKPTEPPRSATAPPPVRFVIFPKYTLGSAPRLTKLPRGRAFLELAGCLFNRNHFEHDGLPILAEVVRQSECFRLETGDLQQTCALLEDELGISPATELNHVQSASCRTLNADCSAEPSVIEPLSLPGLGVAAAMRGAASLVTRRGGVRVGTPEGSNRPSAKSAPGLPTRRDALRLGSRLAYIVPTVMTFSAQKAFAQASNPSGICSTGVATGDLCTTDSDCCSGECSLGVCD